MKAEVKLIDRFRRIDLATLKLLRRYDTLHSGNCSIPTIYRRTLLRRLEYLLPRSAFNQRVRNGHLIERNNHNLR